MCGERDVSGPMLGARRGCVPPDRHGVLKRGFTWALDADFVDVTERDMFIVPLPQGPHPLSQSVSPRRLLSLTPNWLE